MRRILAFSLLLLPGILAAYGIKLIRDSFFAELNPPYGYLWLQSLFGLIWMVIGVYILASFIFYRDRKRRKVQPRFLNRDKK